MDEQRDSQGARSHDKKHGDPIAFADDLPALVPSDAWLKRVAEYGIQLEDREIELLGKYLAALMDVNTRTNLTAIRDAEQAWDRHIFDALTLVGVLQELPESDGRRKVIDVGSGGGLPGVPLAIVMGDVDFVLLDATKKKTDFIARCAQWLGLENLSVINGRAEGVGQDKKHRGVYDGAMARAVGKVAMIAELTVPMVKVGGLVVLTKGEQADEELKQAKKALHMLHTHHVGTVETPTGRVVVLEKQRTTPKMYPRKDGEPKRSPLGITSGKSQ